MVSPLFGFATGALTKYLSDEDASDKLYGNIIDGAAAKYFNVTKPNEDSERKRLENIRNGIIGEYGLNVADIMDSKGYFTTARDLEDAKGLVDKYIQKFGETPVSFRKKIDIFAEEKPEEFKKAFGMTPAVSRITQLKNKEQHVIDTLKDTPSVRDLIVGTKQTGISGALFGGRVTPSGVIPGRERLEQALEVEAPAITTPTVSPEEMFGLQVATPKFSSNNLNKEIATQLQITAIKDPNDPTGSTVLLQPEAQRSAEVNAVKAVALDFMKMPGYKTIEGTGNETLAVQAATKYIQDNVEIPMQQNFKNYRKTSKGWEQIKGAATSISDGLVNRANAYAVEAGGGKESLQKFEKIVEYIVNKELSKLSDNPSAVKYYISLIPESIKSEKGDLLKKAVQLAYNLDLTKAR